VTEGITLCFLKGFEEVCTKSRKLDAKVLEFNESIEERKVACGVDIVGVMFVYEGTFCDFLNFFVLNDRLVSTII